MIGRTVTISLASVLLSCFLFQGVFAQSEETNSASEPNAALATSDDEDIERRIQRIYSQIDALSAVDVTVREGVVFLSGSVSNKTQAERAMQLAAKLQGVVTVDDGIDRSLDIQGNVVPLMENFKGDLARWAQALPLVILALAVFLLIVFAGHRLARWSSLWRRVSPNPFLGELLAQAVRIATIVMGLIIAFNLIGATALIGTILGGAGVVGLAIGFAVRDSLENYISSIMLSLRQPFRANEHVVIGEHEGKVVRLTSRATVLMTLDGNHLRIPNAQVFKAVILNYTRNPERRFEFELGVDANDDPVSAMKIGIDALCQLPFVLDEPEPNALIGAVGDSSILITFMAWVDQRESDFRKSRSLAIAAAKTVLEVQGFTLPEPIYRLRFDPLQAQQLAAVDDMISQATGIGRKESVPETKQTSPTTIDTEAVMDVSPDLHLEEMVEHDRAMNQEDNLLDSDRPVE